MAPETVKTTETVNKQASNSPTLFRRARGAAKDGNPYARTSEDVAVELRLRLDKSGSWEPIGDGEWAEMSEVDKKTCGVESVTFIRPWWSLVKRVESISTRPTLMGFSRDDVAFLENRLKYYLKSCSFAELAFEPDEEEFEMISNWGDIAGPDGPAPEVINAIGMKCLEVLPI